MQKIERADLICDTWLGRQIEPAKNKLIARVRGDRIPLHVDVVWDEPGGTESVQARAAHTEKVPGQVRYALKAAFPIPNQFTGPEPFQYPRARLSIL